MRREAIQTATELYHRRHYTTVLAVLRDVVTEHPDCIEIRLLRARSFAALRRDGEAQRELRHALSIAPKHPAPYQLLGELALRHDRLAAARVFLTEALRLDRSDRHTQDMLRIVKSLIQPTAAVEKLPAAAVAVGCSSSPGTGAHTEPRRRLALGTGSDTSSGRRPVRRPQGFRLRRVDDLDEPTTPDDPSASHVAAPHHSLDSLDDDAITIADNTDADTEEMTPPFPPREPNLGDRGDETTPEDCEDDRGIPGLAGYFLRTGALTPRQLRTAHLFQRRTRKSLCDAVCSLGLLSKTRVDALSAAYIERFNNPRRPQGKTRRQVAQTRPG